MPNTAAVKLSVSLIFAICAEASFHRALYNHLHCTYCLIFDLFSLHSNMTLFASFRLWQRSRDGVRNTSVTRAKYLRK